MNESPRNPSDSQSRPASSPGEVTKLLVNWSAGDNNALGELLPIVYAELRRIAGNYLRRERSGHTLQATALINEAYLKLIDQRDVEWESQTHFYSIAAQAMRRILVDYARTKQRDKRGGDDIKLSLSEAMAVAAKEKSVDLIALDEALDKLAERDAQQARVVELRYFSGLSLDETAEAMHISRATVARDWQMAKAWLLRELR